MGFAADALGWVGAVALLAAFGLVSFRKLAPQGGLYQGLNIFGSFLLVINTGYHRAYPSTAVNVVWIVIAVSSVIHANRKTVAAPKSN